MAFFRAGQDYFPLVQGTRWTYDDGGFTSMDSVAGDSSVLGRRAVKVLRDFSPELWLKSNSEVRRYVRRTVLRAGSEYVLEERYGLEYALPLVVGMGWSESFRDTVVLLGTDSVFVLDSIAASVAAVEDLATPAGTFVQCYRLDVYRVVRTDSVAVEQYQEWLAPGVGVVKRGERVLTGFSTGP